MSNDILRVGDAFMQALRAYERAEEDLISHRAARWPDNELRPDLIAKERAAVRLRETLRDFIR